MWHFPYLSKIGLRYPPPHKKLINIKVFLNHTCCRNRKKSESIQHINCGNFPTVFSFLLKELKIAATLTLLIVFADGSFSATSENMY